MQHRVHSGSDASSIGNDHGGHPAMIRKHSQPGAQAVEGAPMPRWGWGVPGGPYRG
jgi:hypothetical protein